jgi:hypothetical protein
MTHTVGLLLLIGIIIGGVYIYYKVERLNQEIIKQQSAITNEADEELDA